MTSARIASWLAVGLAVALSGCGQQAQTPPPKKAAPSSSATAPLPPAKVVTPETAGKPTLRLAFGEPVTYQREGVSITVAPRSIEKTSDVPLGLDGELVNCGAWWRVVQTWTVDAEPDLKWYSWRRDFQGVFGLFSESKDAQHGFYNDVATSAFSKEPDDLGKALMAAMHGWDRKAPLHFEKTGPQYLAGCKLNDGKDPATNGQDFVPDDRPLTEVQLILPTAEDQKPPSWSTLAIWKK